MRRFGMRVLNEPNVRAERSAASLPHNEAALSMTATSLCPHRSCRPRSRSNALLGSNPAHGLLNHQHYVDGDMPATRLHAHYELRGAHGFRRQSVSAFR